MTLLGLYEQRTSDDGAPFDRAFISSASPAPNPPPRLTPRPACNQGLSYVQGRCRKRFKKQHAVELAALNTWNAKATSDLAGWKSEIADALTRIADGGKTEETGPSQVWNLNAVLLRGGETMAAVPAATQCVVLLGGLAVRQPPPDLPVGQLQSVTLIAAGWRGTPRVQDAWRKALAPAGASIVFLPEAATDIKLVEEVRNCLDGKSPTASGVVQ